MLRLYDYWESGNCYKVRLLLNQIGVRFERVPVDLLAGETRTPEFLARNPNGRVPLVEWPDGRSLAESNAILWHFAEGTSLLPDAPWERAQVLQWLFFEQYSHEPYIAVVRFWHLAGRANENRALIAEKLEKGYQAIGVMEAHLESNTYFVSGCYTIADLSLYAYTHVAHEGGYDLAPFPAVRDWLARVKSQPGHIALDAPAGAGCA